MKRTISKLASESGVGVETVRYYQRLGVLKAPEAEDGWREYPDEAVAAIRYVKEAQRLGFTLAEVKRLKEGAADSPAFCNGVRSAAVSKIAALESEIKRLLHARRELRAFISRCASLEEHARCPIARALLNA